MVAGLSQLNALPTYSGLASPACILYGSHFSAGLLTRPTPAPSTTLSRPSLVSARNISNIPRNSQKNITHPSQACGKNSQVGVCRAIFPVEGNKTQNSYYVVFLKKHCFHLVHVFTVQASH